MNKKHDIIIINGRKFARNDAAMTETLFEPSGTACGYFKKYKRGVEFQDMQGEPFAFLCATHSTPFFVSASRQSNGKTRYNYGLSMIDAKDLGLAGMTHGQIMACADETWKEASA